MTDFLAELAAEGVPESREVTVDGKSGRVYFRRISAGEREELLKGMRLTHQTGKGGSMEIDLAENERGRQMLVMFSVCTADGARYYKNVGQVKKLPASAFNALAEHAESVNKEGDDPGKA